MLTILYDGIAYGMLLFVLACGLSVTLGLMNFINLAHGAFAMAGGYCTVILVNRFGIPFALGLPIAFLVTALIGGVFERTLYVHVYARSHGRGFPCCPQWVRTRHGCEDCSVSGQVHGRAPRQSENVGPDLVPG